MVYKIVLMCKYLGLEARWKGRFVHIYSQDQWIYSGTYERVFTHLSHVV